MEVESETCAQETSFSGLMDLLIMLSQMTWYRTGMCLVFIQYTNFVARDMVLWPLQSNLGTSWLCPCQNLVLKSIEHGVADCYSFVQSHSLVFLWFHGHMCLSPVYHPRVQVANMHSILVMFQNVEQLQDAVVSMTSLVLLSQIKIPFKVVHLSWCSIRS